MGGQANFYINDCCPPVDPAVADEINVKLCNKVWRFSMSCTAHFIPEEMLCGSFSGSEPIAKS